MTKNTKSKKSIKDNVPESPSKQEEFGAFLDLLRGPSIAHWVQVAKVLGVAPDTITRWKKTPAAQKAIRDGIELAMDGMTAAGKDDWKMWESKLKMLGISPIEKSDITSDGEALTIVEKVFPPANKNAS